MGRFWTWKWGTVAPCPDRPAEPRRRGARGRRRGPGPPGNRGPSRRGHADGRGPAGGQLRKLGVADARRRGQVVRPALPDLRPRPPELPADARGVPRARPSRGPEARPQDGRGGHRANAAPCRFEHRIIRSDGQERILRCQGEPIVDPQSGDVVRVVGVVQDVSEQLRRPSALREAEADARFRSAFENAPIGIALVDFGGGPDGRLTEVNRALVELTGRGEQELVGSTLPALALGEDAELDLALRERLVAGEIDRFSIEKRALFDDRLVWFQLSVSALPEAGVGVDPGDRPGPGRHGAQALRGPASLHGRPRLAHGADEPAPVPRGAGVAARAPAPLRRRGRRAARGRRPPEGDQRHPRTRRRRPGPAQGRRRDDEPHALDRHRRAPRRGRVRGPAAERGCGSGGSARRRAHRPVRRRGDRGPPGLGQHRGRPLRLRGRRAAHGRAGLRRRRRGDVPRQAAGRRRRGRGVGAARADDGGERKRSRRALDRNAWPSVSGRRSRRTSCSSTRSRLWTFAAARRSTARSWCGCARDRARCGPRRTSSPPPPRSGACARRSIAGSCGGRSRPSATGPRALRLHLNLSGETLTDEVGPDPVPRRPHRGARAAGVARARDRRVGDPGQRRCRLSCDPQARRNRLPARSGRVHRRRRVVRVPPAPAARPGQDRRCRHSRPDRGRAGSRRRCGRSSTSRMEPARPPSRSSSSRRR